MCSYVFVLLTELLSSNKKYGVKQRQYKLFAGELHIRPITCACFQAFFVVCLCGLNCIKGEWEWV
jgi:hypothetical protein